MMSLLNRKRYDARWLWDWAKSTDEWPETNPGDDQGTSVRAACEILRSRGHVPWKATFKGRSYKQRDKEEPARRRGHHRLPVGQDRRRGPRHPQEPGQRRRRRGADPQLVGPRLPAPGVDARRDPAAADRRGRRGRADHRPLSVGSGAREVAALEAPRPRQAGERADGEHRRGAAGLEGLGGHEADVVERGEVERPAAAPRSARRSSPTGRPPRRARRRSSSPARGASARARAPRPRKSTVTGRQLAPASIIRASETPAPCDAAPAQASTPAASASAAAAAATSSSRSANQRAAADGQGEQGLEPLLGLVLAHGGQLEAREEAEGEQEVLEGEAQVAGGRRRRRSRASAGGPERSARAPRRRCRR